MAVAAAAPAGSGRRPSMQSAQSAQSATLSPRSPQAADPRVHSSGTSPEPPPQPHLVHLNVGGRRFTTFRATLLQQVGVTGAEGDTGTFFSCLLSSGLPCDTDERGAIFIDRDPVLFETVLHYLRTGEWAAPPGVDSARVLREAQFYGLKIDACDFTIPWLREEVALQRRYDPHSQQVSGVAQFIQAEFDKLLREGRDLAVAILPGFATMKQALSEVRIRTGPDTNERIDLDKLQVAHLTSEGVRHIMSDDTFSVLAAVPPEAVVWYMKTYLHYTVHIEVGSVYFPYSSTLRKCEEDVVAVAAPHAPIYSKLHGTLHIACAMPSHHDDCAPSQTEASMLGEPQDGASPGAPAPSPAQGDRFANLHTRYFPVCEARYVMWEEDRRRRLLGHGHAGGGGMLGSMHQTASTPCSARPATPPKTESEVSD